MFRSILEFMYLFASIKITIVLYFNLQKSSLVFQFLLIQKVIYR